MPPLTLRHCERSEAIHSFFPRRDGLLRFARNDGEGLFHAASHPSRHCEERSDEAIQSFRSINGLLRGACHRARAFAVDVGCVPSMIDSLEVKVLYPA